MANEITTDNINTLAPAVASVADGDYIYVFKAGASGFSRIEVNLLKEMFGNEESEGSGSIDAAVYEAIKANVNTVQQKVDALISVLAGIAFNNLPKPQAIGNLVWPSADSNTPVLTSPSVNSIDLGSSTEDTRTTTFLLKGLNLTQGVTLSVSGTGFSVNPSSVSAANANSGVNVTVTHTDTSSKGGTASGTLTISSTEVSKTISLSARKGSSTGTQFSVNVSLIGCTISNKASGSVGSVDVGGTFTATLVPDTGYTLPSEITVNGTHGTVSYSNGAISIPNVTTDITIIATATQSGVQDYVTGMILHLDGMNQGSNGGKWTDTVDGKQFTLFGSPDNEENGTPLNGFKFDDVDKYGTWGDTSDSNDMAFLNSLDFNSCTIEVCFTPVGTWPNQNRTLFLAGGTDDSDTNICLSLYQNNGNLNSIISTYSSTNNSNKPVCMRVIDALSNIIGSNTLTVSANVDMTIFKGAKADGTLSDARFGTANGSVLMLGVRKSMNSGNIGTISAGAIIHDVRIYPTTLTEEQIKHNQEVDNSRYGAQNDVNGNS